MEGIAAVEEASVTGPLLVQENPETGCANGILSNYDDESLTLGQSAVTPVLIFSIIVANTGALAFGCATGYSSPVELQIVAELGLSTAEYSLFGSLLTVGGLAGALLGGMMIDYIGRRGAMGLSNLFCIFGWVVIICSKAAWSLDMGRFFTGVGIGLLMYTVSVYVAEITPKNIRGRAVVLVQLMISIGTSFTYIVGLLVNWRILAAIGMLPCLMQFVGLFFIPASPRYLAKIGLERECEAALHRLRGERFDVSDEVSDIKGFTETLRQLQQTKFLHLFQRRYARALTIGIGLAVLSQLTGVNGVQYYVSDIFESAGYSSTFGTLAVAVIQLPSSALGVFCSDKPGKRPIALIWAAGICCSCIIIALGFELQEHELLLNISPYIVLTGLMGFFVTYALATAVPFAIMSEIFPLNIKASAGTLALSMQWAVGWILSYSFSFMMEWSSSGSFFILAGTNAFTFLFIAKLMPETRGRTLEEIQRSMTQYKRWDNRI